MNPTFDRIDPSGVTVQADGSILFNNRTLRRAVLDTPTDTGSQIAADNYGTCTNSSVCSGSNLDCANTGDCSGADNLGQCGKVIW